MCLKRKLSALERGSSGAANFKNDCSLLSSWGGGHGRFAAPPHMPEVECAHFWTAHFPSLDCTICPLDFIFWLDCMLKITPVPI
jgi:hypothetical protein